MQPTNILNFLDIDQAEWDALVDRAIVHYQAGPSWSTVAHGKSLGMVLMNSSLRTRTSMELAAAQLGAHVTTLVSGAGVWGFEWEPGAVMDGDRAEHISEAVGVLSRYYDGLGLRAFASMTDAEEDFADVRMKQFSIYSSVPVINLESASFHPCQALADASAIRIAHGIFSQGSTGHEELQAHTDGEDRGHPVPWQNQPGASRLAPTARLVNGKRRSKKFVLSWAYHPRALPMAVPNSTLLMAAREGFDVTVASPSTHRLDERIVQEARKIAAITGGSVKESDSLDDAARDATIVYAKAWGGRELYVDKDREAQQRQSNQHWRITADVMAKTDGGSFMHCLPVRRNVVVDDVVLDGDSSLHLLQAEMRLYGQKALLERMWGLGVPGV